MGPRRISSLCDRLCYFGGILNAGDAVKYGDKVASPVGRCEGVESRWNGSRRGTSSSQDQHMRPQVASHNKKCTALSLLSCQRPAVHSESEAKGRRPSRWRQNHGRGKIGPELRTCCGLRLGPAPPGRRLRSPLPSSSAARPLHSALIVPPAPSSSPTS
jgi:hypothetical protein